MESSPPQAGGLRVSGSGQMPSSRRSRAVWFGLTREVQIIPAAGGRPAGGLARESCPAAGGRLAELGSGKPPPSAGARRLYLRWLDRYERHPGEETPIGLILCAEKTAEHVELLRLEESGIRVAEYMTELPARDLLERKLQQAIKSARRTLAARASSFQEPA